MNFTKNQKVTTPLGKGKITGAKESFYNGSTVRYEVQLENPENWSFGPNKNPFFFLGEIKNNDQ